MGEGSWFASYGKSWSGPSICGVLGDGGVCSVETGSAGVDCDNGTGCSETLVLNDGLDAVAPPTVIDRPRDMRRSGGSVAQSTARDCSLPELPLECSLPDFLFDCEELRDFPVELDVDLLCERDSELAVDAKSRKE